MKKTFVAIVTLVIVLTTMMVTAYAEYDWNGAKVEATDVYVNSDGRHEMDFRIGDHWVLKFISDSYYSDTAEWYAEYDGELIWWDKEYQGTYEDDENLDFTIMMMTCYYYEGLEL